MDTSPEEVTKLVDAVYKQLKQSSSSKCKRLMDLGISWDIINTAPFHVACFFVDKKPNKFSEYFQVLHSDITVLMDFILIHLELLAFISHCCFVNSSD